MKMNSGMADNWKSVNPRHVEDQRVAENRLDVGEVEREQLHDERGGPRHYPNSQ